MIALIKNLASKRIIRYVKANLFERRRLKILLFMFSQSKRIFSFSEIMNQLLYNCIFFDRKCFAWVAHAVCSCVEIMPQSIQFSKIMRLWKFQMPFVRLGWIHYYTPACVWFGVYSWAETCRQQAKKSSRLMVQLVVQLA